MKNIFIACALVIFTNQCASQKKDPVKEMPKTSSAKVNNTYPKTAPASGIQRLKEKENIFLPNEKLNLTFIRMVEDNRCPVDVNCLRAGEALVEVQVMGVYTRPRNFILSQDLKNEKNSFVFNGKKFSLENVYPSRFSSVKLEELQGHYVIDIKVEPTKQ